MKDFSDKDSFRRQAPPVVELPTLHIPEIRRKQLPDGGELNIYNKPGMPVVYLSAVTRGGVAEAKSPAIATLTSVMRREGSMEFNRETIAETLDFNGAVLRNDMTSHHLTQSLYSLESRLPNVIDLFADTICRPVFPSKEFATRREALANNIELSYENVSYLANVECEKQIMGGSHPLASADSPDDTRHISTDCLKEFYGQRVAADNLQLFVCGDISHETERMITEAFSKRTVTGQQNRLNIQKFDAVEAGDIRIIRKSMSSQSCVMLSLPAIPRSHPDYLPLHLTVYALGGYFGSRLMLNIREDKGLTYGISASMPGYIDDAYICISAETDNAYVWQVVDEIRNEMTRLASNPYHGDELTRLKQSALSSQASILDSPISILDQYVISVTQGLPENYFNAKQTAIESLTPEIIREMTLKYLNPESIRISIAGNPT